MIGWLAATLLALHAKRLRRRLEAVADAEHELRGALTAFGFAVEAGAAGRLREALASELARARAALADLAALREGRPSDSASPVALHAFVRSAAAAWLPAARAGGRRVEVDWRAGPVFVRADRGRLAQALGNLLANAVEHGTGPIRLRATRECTGVRVEVVNEVAGRGRGLRIASRAAGECGGTLSLVRDDERATAAVELPLAS